LGRTASQLVGTSHSKIFERTPSREKIFDLPNEAAGRYEHWLRGGAVTLRGRLGVAFTAILLAPMALGAAALAGLAPPPTSESVPDPERAAAAVRAVVAVHCAHLEATAQGLAISAAVAGDAWAVSPPGATGPWAICGPPGDSPSAPTVPTGLAARAVIKGAGGAIAGYAYAVQPVDDHFLAELSAAAGGRVRLSVDGGLRTYPDQPLPLTLAPTPNSAPPDPVPLLLVAAAVALLAAALLGWWLADLATRPLRHLVATIDRVTGGDLTVRSSLSGRDETGRLGRRLNEMIVGMQETQRLSVTDPLTGLGNVRYLTEELRLEIERASRFGRALGVLALDLDHFKNVNDRYGHRAGDQVLMELAGRIRRAVREVDLAFRRGGEEFVILLPETDIAGSLTAARRVGDAVRDAPFPLNGPESPGGVDVTVSIGVAVYPRHARTGVDLLDAADQALYAAKAAGRDTFVLAAGALPSQWAPEPIPAVSLPMAPRWRQRPRA
jgi:diguanylate cyclase (GGDEF)-like protein